MNTFISGLVCYSYNLFIQKKIINWKLFRPLIIVGILTGIKFIYLYNTNFFGKQLIMDYQIQVLFLLQLHYIQWYDNE